MIKCNGDQCNKGRCHSANVFIVGVIMLHHVNNPRKHMKNTLVNENVVLKHKPLQII